MSFDMLDAGWLIWPALVPVILRQATARIKDVTDILFENLYPR
jgi:hypothetical protein